MKQWFPLFFMQILPFCPFWKRKAPNGLVFKNFPAHAYISMNKGEGIPLLATGKNPFPQQCALRFPFKLEHLLSHS